MRPGPAGASRSTGRLPGPELGSEGFVTCLDGLGRRWGVIYSRRLLPGRDRENEDMMLADGLFVPAPAKITPKLKTFYYYHHILNDDDDLQSDVVDYAQRQKCRSRVRGLKPYRVRSFGL